MKDADLALSEGEEFDASELQAFEQRRDILLIARKAIVAPTLHAGACGDEIVQAQELLNAAGAHLPVGGFFGAVKAEGNAAKIVDVQWRLRNLRPKLKNSEKNLVQFKSFWFHVKRPTLKKAEGGAPSALVRQRWGKN